MLIVFIYCSSHGKKNDTFSLASSSLCFAIVCYTILSPGCDLYRLWIGLVLFIKNKMIETPFVINTNILRLFSWQIWTVGQSWLGRFADYLATILLLFQVSVFVSVVNVLAAKWINFSPNHIIRTIGETYASWLHQLLIVRDYSLLSLEYNLEDAL